MLIEDFDYKQYLAEEFVSRNNFYPVLVSHFGKHVIQLNDFAETDFSFKDPPANGWIYKEDFKEVRQEIEKLEQQNPEIKYTSFDGAKNSALIYAVPDRKEVGQKIVQYNDRADLLSKVPPTECASIVIAKKSFFRELPGSSDFRRWYYIC